MVSARGRRLGGDHGHSGSGDGGAVLRPSDLRGSYPNRVRAIAESGVVASIDPSTTSTPVQDATDAIDNAGPLVGSSGMAAGAVLLPPKTNIQEQGPIQHGAFKWFLGHGITSSVIEITNLSGNGIQQDSNESQDWSQCYLDGLAFHGSDTTNRTAGSAIYIDQNARGMGMGYVKFRNWGGSDPVVFFDGASTFDQHWGSLLFDAKNIETKNFRTEGAGGLGTGLSIGNIIGGASDQTDFVFDFDVGGHLGIDVLQIENNAGIGMIARSVGGEDDILQIGRVHYENSNNNNPGEAVRLDPSGYRVELGTVGVAGPNTTVDDIVRLDETDNVFIGHVGAATDATATDRIDINKAPTGPGVYMGPTSHVNNSVGSTAEGLFCVADQRYADPLAPGTMTLTGGSGTGVKTTQETDVTSDQLADLNVILEVDSDPSNNFDYGWRPEKPTFDWDDSDSAIDVTVRANLTNDPGMGNDVTLAYEVTTAPGNA